MDAFSKISDRKNSVGCLNLMSPKTSSPINYSKVDNKIHLTKSKSLPAHCSMKNFNKIFLNVLNISSDEIANQLTLLDFEVFQLIEPEELTTCAWTKKDKNVNTPNIVAFTKRFNHTSFWIVQEILDAPLLKQRVELLSHFIKMAKKLHALNNLHSLFAVVSALQSASIYRLEKTWNLLSKKDKQAFDKLREIFADENNWQNLRNYLESLRLPCIPYLGLFLTDLVYIDMIHPHADSYFEPSQRRNKMNNILRVIANYQQSNYSHIIRNKSIQEYIKSISYIDELQNIFEEDQYKKSLLLEPTNILDEYAKVRTANELKNTDKLTTSLECIESVHKKNKGSIRLESQSKHVHGHRKCSSLGSNIFWTLKGNNSNNTFLDDQFKHNYKQRNLLDNSESELNYRYKQRNLLDDSELESPYPCNNNDKHIEKLSSISASIEVPLSTKTIAIIQGHIYRKTIQKDWRKVKLAQWQRYWLILRGNALVYFLPKFFKGYERNDFRLEPYKICSLDGWCARKLKKNNETFTFELYNKSLGHIYKIRTNTLTEAHRWMSCISQINDQQIYSKSQSLNLMSFE